MLPPAIRILYAFVPQRRYAKRKALGCFLCETGRNVPGEVAAVGFIESLVDALVDEIPVGAADEAL